MLKKLVKPHEKKPEKTNVAKYTRIDALQIVILLYLKNYEILILIL